LKAVGALSSFADITDVAATATGNAIVLTPFACEYFLSETAKRDRAREERKAKQEEATGAKAKQVCSSHFL
jgi:hypothetical protein